MIRVFEAFAGYGSQSMALERLKQDYPQLDYEVVGISEIDKYAVKAYNATHEPTTNYGDICLIDWDSVPDFDLFTYSFPCQDISSAGKQKGLEAGSGTRSSLLWECKKAIEEKRPKYLLMENVKALVCKKFIRHFNDWLLYLESLGYSNFWKVLNAKNYGVPQNRERVFVVSILGNNEQYKFPKPFELTKILKDVLEENIQDCYKKSKAAKWILSKSGKKTLDMGFAQIDGDVSICITSRGFNAWNCSYVTRANGVITILTNREVFRLMGVSETDIDKIQAAGISNSQQYKMAGNSIVVDVLYYISKSLFIEKPSKQYLQLKLF